VKTAAPIRLHQLVLSIEIREERSYPELPALAAGGTDAGASAAGGAGSAATASADAKRAEAGAAPAAIGAPAAPDAIQYPPPAGVRHTVRLTVKPRFVVHNRTGQPLSVCHIGAMLPPAPDSSSTSLGASAKAADSKSAATAASVASDTTVTATLAAGATLSLAAWDLSTRSEVYDAKHVGKFGPAVRVTFAPVTDAADGAAGGATAIESKQEVLGSILVAVSVTHSCSCLVRVCSGSGRAASASARAATWSAARSACGTDASR
jgi:hypothetical protein